jgi:diguanylate cyclase (GGDEF)-like protein
MLQAIKDWCLWFFRKIDSRDAVVDVAHSNLSSIRRMGAFVIVLEVVTLIYVLTTSSGQIQSRFASSLSVAMIIGLCAVSICVVIWLQRRKNFSVLAANVLLVTIFVLATAWGIWASYRHYVVGEQILTFYIVQLCFICFILTTPLQAVLMYGGAFGTFYAMLFAFDGAQSINVTNYILFTVIAILGSTVRYQSMIDVYARGREIDKLNEGLRHSSTHDELTGLLNRVALRERFDGYIGQNLHLLLVDVDRFKEFNDVFGHLAGDRVLVAVADTLTNNFGHEGTFRYGGDEFLVILPDVTNVQLAEKISCWQGEVASIELEGISRRIICSAGITAGTPTSPAELRALIEHADTSLYNVKAQNHARVDAGAKAQ